MALRHGLRSARARRRWLAVDPKEVGVVMDKILMMVHGLISCDWGRNVGLPDDQEPCPEQAQQRFAIHLGDEQIILQVCDHHKMRLYEHTDPHAGELTT